MNIRWFEKHLGGHIGGYVFGQRWTLYGFNAMHIAFELKTRRWGWLCFHPWTPFYRGWAWYFYASPNGRPIVSTIAVGPGLSQDTKRLAAERRGLFGHNFNEDMIYDGPYSEWLG